MTATVCRKECPHEDEVVDFGFDDYSGKCSGCGATMRVVHPTGPGDGCDYEEARGTANDCDCPKCTPEGQG